MHIRAVKLPKFYLNEVSCLYRTAYPMLSSRHESRITEERALKFKYKGS